MAYFITLSIAITILINLPPSVNQNRRGLVTVLQLPGVVRCRKTVHRLSAHNHKWLALDSTDLIPLQRRGISPRHPELSKWWHGTSIDIAGKTLINAFVGLHQMWYLQRAVANKDNVRHTAQRLSIFSPVVTAQFQTSHHKLNCKLEGTQKVQNQKPSSAKQGISVDNIHFSLHVFYQGAAR